jgi:CubicO group peptidase (beta-lactamase class C family)
VNPAIAGPDSLPHGIDAALAGADAPGVQYVAVDPAATLVDAAAGWADVAGRRPLEPGTTMMVYSMTKTVTAVAVLQLVERGAVALDAPVRTLVPEIPYGDRVTLRHLLAQTSGIPDPLPLRWVHLPEEHAGYDERAMLARRLAENPRLRFAPGTRYAYSNLSYWLLGAAVERAAGVPYEAYVRANVFERLGLGPAEIGFSIPDRERHAKGYLPRRSLLAVLRPFLIDRKFVGEHEGRWLHVEDNYLDGAAFGGIVATARAMGRFLQDQLRDRSVLLGPEARRLLVEPQRTARGAPAGTTLGWHVAPRGRAYLFKEGGGAGFHSEMRIDPARRIGSVAIGNSATFDVKRLLDAADRGRSG